MSTLRMDHVIYAVDDLDEAAAGLFDREGLASVPGGRHEGWGTANRIVPLGPDYLELVGVVDRQAAEASSFGRLVLDAGDGLVGWSIGTDDLDRVASRLGLEIVRGKRKRPDGVRLTGIDHFQRDVSHVLRIQVIQETLDKVRILVLPAPGYSERDAAQLLQNARAKVPDSMQLRIETSEWLERTPRGKTPLVIHRAPVQEQLRLQGVEPSQTR